MNKKCVISGLSIVKNVIKPGSLQWFTENPIVVFYYVANKLEKKRSENIKYSLINACGGCSGHQNS